MEMNDKTILRIKVPAHLYESVKAQLTLNEAKGKQNLGAGMEVVEEKKSSGGKKPKAPKAIPPREKANAPLNVTDRNTPPADKDIKGAGMTEKKLHKDGHKKIGLDKLKALAEMLNGQIAEMEKHEEGKVEEYHEPENVYDDDDEIEDDSKKKVKEARDFSVGLPIKGNILWVTYKVRYMIETAIENGQKVEINGEMVSSIDNKRNIIYTETGEEYQLQVLTNLSAITIDGKHIADIDPKVSTEIERIRKESEPTFKKPEHKPKPADPDAAKKAGEEWMNRYGPGGGQETYAGRYTGD